MDIIDPAEEAQAPVPPRGGEETRRRLMESAVEVFADRGYHAATLSEIAARAGLTTGAVYSTFGSKKALLLAACSEGATDDEFESILARARHLRDALDELVRDRARVTLNPATLRQVKLQVELLKLSLDEPGLFATISESGRTQLAVLAQLIEDLAARDGVELPMPAAELAMLLNALLNGLGLIQLVDPALVPERIFVRGLHALMGWDQPTDDDNPT